jgi:polygalacturonase
MLTLNTFLHLLAKANPKYPASLGGVILAMAIMVSPAASGQITPALPSIPPGIFKITDYGAVGDGVTTNSAAIQKTVAAALAAGGGTVEVPAGSFLSGPFTLGSRIKFQLDSGATLLMLPYGSYPMGGKARLGHKHSQPPSFITVNDAHDIEFAGPGKIDGQGAPWWKQIRIESRPLAVHLDSCQRVYVHNWNSVNPPMKHLFFDGYNSDITIEDVTNVASYPSPNTDCLNLQGVRCLVRDCVFHGGDDNIAMGCGSGPVKDVLITNITCGTGHGISIGSVTKGGIANVTVVDCTFSNTDYGLRLKGDSDRGGVVQNINFKNIQLTGVRSPILIYGYYNEKKSVNVSPRLAESYPPVKVTNHTPIWRDITYSNITASSTSDAGIIWGRPEMLVSNVTLDHVTINAPGPFRIYNARNVQLTDTKVHSSASKPFEIYNAQVITNGETTEISRAAN